MTGIELINAWLVESEQSLISKYNQMGLKASGQWAKDLESKSETTADGYKATILSSRYTEQLIEGRKPNKNQNKVKGFAYFASRSGGFIYEWCQNKGIDTKFAFPIALSIGVNGIKVPNQYNSGDLLSSTINKNNIEKLLISLGKNTVINEFQGIAK